MKIHTLHIESSGTVTPGAAPRQKWISQKAQPTQPSSVNLKCFPNLGDLELYVIKGPVQLPARYLHRHELIYCPSGSFQLNCSGQARRLYRGNFVTLRAGESVGLRLASGSASCTLISFAKSTDWTFSEGKTPRDPSQRPEGESSPLAPALHILFSALAATEMPPTLETDLAAGLASLSHNYALLPSPKQVHPAVARAKEAFHNAPERRFSLDGLARVARLNKSHLSEVFKRDVGVTPLTYQTCLRLHLSKERLRQSLSIAQVALELGFSDQSHFTHIFKTFLGVTPGRFQRSGFSS